jgi:hypothetical protein
MVFQRPPDSIQFNGKVTEGKKDHQTVNRQGLEKRTEVGEDDPCRHGGKDHEEK